MRTGVGVAFVGDATLLLGNCALLESFTSDVISMGIDLVSGLGNGNGARYRGRKNGLLAGISFWVSGTGVGILGIAMFFADFRKKS
jgi:hypothetical protein